MTAVAPSDSFAIAPGIAQSGGVGDPHNLTFANRLIARQLNLLPDFCVQVADDFNLLYYDNSGTKSTLYTAAHNSGGTRAVGNGTYQYSSASATAQEYVCAAWTPVRAPFYTVMATIKAWAGGASEDKVQVGIASTDASTTTAFSALYQHSTTTLSLNVRTAGTDHLTTLSSSCTLAAGTTLAFVLTEQRISAFTNDGTGWTYWGTINAGSTGGYADTRLQANITGLVPFFMTSQLANSAVVLDSFKAGFFGTVGAQDPQFVTLPDGTPYIRDNKAYLTICDAGLNETTGITGNCTWSQGVWTLDLGTYQVAEVGKLFMVRPLTNGGANTAVLGDSPGKIVYDPSSGVFTCVFCTWGSRALSTDGVRDGYVQWAQFSHNILQGVHFLDGWTPMALPTPDTAGATVYDPDCLFINGQWYVSYVESGAVASVTSFRPALASCATLGGTFTLVGRPAASNNGEGTRLAKVNGSYYVLCGIAGSPSTMPVYDLTMTQLGTLSYPGINTTITTHPCLGAFPDNVGRTRFLLIGFDNGGLAVPGATTAQSWTWGNLYVFEATQKTTGDEFAIRQIRRAE